MRTSIGWGALAGLLAVTGPAAAGLLPIHVGVTGEGTNFRYSYGVLLESDSVLKTGDYFTVYDFAGFVTGSNAQPADFAFQSLYTGPTPALVLPGDDPNLPNLTWKYTGADMLAGQLDLGDFTAVSAYETTAYDDFAGRTHREVDGRLNTNITDTNVPVPVNDCHVPEPASLVLLGLAVPLGLVMRRIGK